MKRLFCLLLCLPLIVMGSGAEDDCLYEDEYESCESEYVMIEKDLFEYYVEEIIGRAGMTMRYLAEGKYDRDIAIYHLDEVLTIASILQQDYCE